MKITYFFVHGRQKRINKNDNFAKEMYYSYFHFKDKYPDTSFVEFKEPTRVFGSFLKILDKYLNKATKLPFFMSNVVNYSNFKKIINSDHIICAQDRIAVSLLPIFKVVKIIKPNLKISFFVMGLFNKEDEKKVIKSLRSYFIKSIYKQTDNIIFLGKGEYDLALNNYPIFLKKSHLLPFMVDDKFWSKNSNLNFETKSGILFIGNDGHRDYELLVEIAKRLKNYQFTFVTKKFMFEKLDLSNVKVFDGSWGNELLTDEELRDLYRKSKITIIPIKKTTQPSGQSVTLQSMCTGTPVIISDFPGLWDKIDIVNHQNIIIAEDNELKNWVALIENSYKNNEKLESISKEAMDLINKKYKEDLFNKNLSQILGLKSEKHDKE